MKEDEKSGQLPKKSPYDSTVPIRGSRPATNSCMLLLAKKMGTKLPFTKPTGAICTNFIKEDLSSNLSHSKFINNVRFSCEAYNTATETLYAVAALSHVYWTLFFPFIFCIGIITDLISPKEAEYFFLTLTPNPLNTTFIGLFFVSIAISSLWVSILNQKIKLPGLGAQMFFEFNRQTGMVTRFERNRILYSYSFTDFDCFLMTRFTNKGFPRYSLELYPRYQNTRKGIPLSNLLSEEFTDTNEYLRLWSMIQRYMDTSQPLPDISILEEFRAKDPVTAAYDKETKRNSHYWREMTDEKYIKKLEQIDYEQEDSYPLGDPLPFEIIDDASAA